MTRLQQLIFLLDVHIANTCSRCANTVKNSLCNLKTFIPNEAIDIDVEGSGFNLTGVTIGTVGQSVVSLMQAASVAAPIAKKYVIGMCYIDEINGIPSTYTGACYTGSNI